MNAKPTRPHAPLLTLGDIYYILFRHKWKILLFSAIGLIAAAIIPFVWPHVYESEAKLLVKYVVDNRVLSDPTGDARVSLPDGSGRNIINTELQILTSLDLANEVATNVGPDKILGKPKASIYEAGAFIHNHLLVDPNNSDVIQIIFKHPDPTVVQPVLAQIISTYLERHAQVHRPEGADEFLTQETDQLRRRLASTEEALRSAKTNLGIISLDDAQKVFGEKISRIQQDIDDSKALLAQHQAAVDELAKRTKIDQLPTNTVTAAAASTNAPSPEKVTEYKHVSDMVDAFRTEEKSLLLQFLPGNSRVKDVRDQIASAEKQKKQLEDENPGLLAKKVAEAKVANPESVLQNDLITENATVMGLQSKIQVLTNELAEVRGHFAAVDAGASAITELERTRKLEEAHYTYYSESLENAHIDEALRSNKNSNINTIQNPSPPFRDVSKMTKVAAGVGLFGIIFGLALAFFIELYLDHSVRRPTDIESRLGIPLFLSIPYRNGKGKVPLLNAPPKSGLMLRSEALKRTIPLNGAKTTVGRLPENTVSIDEGSVSLHHCEIYSRNGEVIVKDLGSTNGTFINGERIVEMPIRTGQTLRFGNVEFRVESKEAAAESPAPEDSLAVMPPWDPRHALRPFYDTLRDRLITYFEVKNLTHNPKLVALTSCGDSAGVTSTAAGLAAALSETGEGNVLLVDMNVERGAAHHFYKGHLSCGIDEALAKEKRHEALVQDNLYVVTESSGEDSLPRVLPKRFTNLVSKMKASDFDYIIFDMPPMSQISITPRLARFMDMVMVVVESEKTDRHVVQRALTMLTETRANVGVVLNKRKKYVPQRIQQEL
jgi:uncharacterized protein involved in exopolysaccharide biosynthesis/Mrp family chromosome partitioning ATPase